MPNASKRVDACSLRVQAQMDALRSVQARFVFNQAVRSAYPMEVESVHEFPQVA